MRDTEPTLKDRVEAEAAVKSARHSYEYRNDMHLVTQIVRNLVESSEPLKDGTYFVVCAQEIRDFRMRKAKTPFQKRFEQKWRMGGRSRRLMHCYFLQVSAVKALDEALKTQKEETNDVQPA